MAKEAEKVTGSAERELVITRVFDAPRKLVWKAWTDPEHFMKWWGPKDFTSPTCKMDLRVGGKYLYCMQGPDGRKFWSTGTFREIIQLEKLVFTDSFADAKGNVIHASETGMDVGEGWPLEFLVTIRLEDFSGKTKMTLTHAGIPEGQMSDMTFAGWNESFDKLAASLK